MPLTKRQLKFVDGQIMGMNGAEAARHAGFAEKSAKGTALRLRKNPDVVAEIEMRQAKLAEGADITAQSLIRELDEQILAANGRGNDSAAARCIELKAKMTGHLVDRSLNANLHAVQEQQAEPVDKAELIAMIDRIICQNNAVEHSVKQLPSPLKEVVADTITPAGHLVKNLPKHPPGNGAIGGE